MEIKTWPFLRRKFHRVLDQVPKNLLHPRRVGPEMNFLRAEIELEREMFLFDVSVANLEGVAQQRVRIDDLRS